jgi:nucleoside-diphosphate-sugar epimerase
MTHDVFVTGGTGYIGRALLTALQARSHRVRALVRAGSEHRLPPGVPFVVGDVLRDETFFAHVAPANTLVHLVGVPHPSPAKADQFERIDGASARAALHAAHDAGVRHFVYVSVAQPAPIMHAYVAVRASIETAIHTAHAHGGPAATILRPWYVLGPGHQWPHLLRPLYALGRLLPSTRAGAERLGLVTHAQMVAALVHAVETPHDDVRVIDVPGIRRAVPA